jgi:hypothetical protein
VPQLFTEFKKAYDSVRKEVFYDIATEFGIPMKLVMLMKMCLNKTHGTIQLVKHLSDMFPTENDLKQGEVLRPSLFNFT